MKGNEKSNFAALMTAVSELYGKKMTPTLLRIYWLSLERFNFIDIREAVTTHVNNPDIGQFMPKPADIVRYLEGDSETHGLNAWYKVESAIRKIGAYDSVAFDDPIIHRVILDMGGWQRICVTPDKEIPFRSNEFIKRYRHYLTRRPTHYPKYLAGTVEHNNQRNGYLDCAGTPTLVGNKQIALGVIAGGSDTPFIPIHYDGLLTSSMKKVIDYEN